MKFPRSKRDNFTKLLKHKSIGPGHYKNPKNRTINTSFSFGKSERFKSKVNEHIFKPGPDRYNIPSYIITAPKYLFKKARSKKKSYRTEKP